VNWLASRLAGGFSSRLAGGLAFGLAVGPALGLAGRHGLLAGIGLVD
jgi:hypothetical protein